MTPAPAPPEVPLGGRPNRVVADLDDDLAFRLRTWAGMRRQPVSRIVCELIRRAVPTADQLAAQMQQNGAGQ